MRANKPLWIKICLGLAALAVLATALFFLPKDHASTLDKYQDLFNRQEFAACRTGLLNELKKQPDWHEARTLLIKVCIQEKDLDAATENLLYLLSAGEKDTFAGLIINSLKSEPTQQKACIDRVRNYLVQNPNLSEAWLLLARFKLELKEGSPQAVFAIVFELERLGEPVKPVADYLFRNFPNLPVEDQNSIFSALEDLITEDADNILAYTMYMDFADRISDRARQLKGIEVASQPGVHSDIKTRAERTWTTLISTNVLDGNMIEFALELSQGNILKVVNILKSLEDEKIKTWLTLYPDNPLLMFENFFRHGYYKAQLKDLRSFYLLLKDYPDRERFTVALSNLLIDVPIEQIEVQDLEQLSNITLIDLYSSRLWRSDSPAETSARERLDKISDYSQVMKLFDDLTSLPQAPEPVWSFTLPPNHSYISLSPAGDWAVIYNYCYVEEPDTLDWHFLNLETMEASSPQPQYRGTSWPPFRWSPDGQWVILPDDKIYYPKLGQERSVELTENMWLEGWYDDNHLLLRHQLLGSGTTTYYSYHIETSQITSVFSGGLTKAFYSSSGQVAFISNRVVKIGDNTFTLPQEMTDVSVISAGIFGKVGGYDIPTIQFFSFVDQQINDFHSPLVALPWDRTLQYTPEGFSFCRFSAGNETHHGVLTPDLNIRLLGITSQNWWYSGNYLITLSERRVNIYYITN